MQPQESTLPFLREDLQLLENAPAEDGSKQWLLFDPIQNRYFTIGIDTFELITHWEGGVTLSAFLVKLDQEGYEIDEEGLNVFLGFVQSNGLIKSGSIADTKRLYGQKKQMRQHPLKWLLHNYLFIRIPLVKPDKWLSKYVSKVDFFYSPMWQSIVLLLGFLGLMMVMRDWENFKSTFGYFFSAQGMLYYIISLALVKSAHELGHAFTAKRYGAKVPSMGLAFLVLFPVLYTDTTNAYAFKSKYQRLHVAMAGMKVEIYLAMIATFLWSFLPDGILKSVAFTIATTSWITSLLVNISPFLRFDGYYVLSDWTDTKNLQPRSFAMARWFIRHYILGALEQQPEMMSVGRKRFFIAYAIATWIYRFFLFVGIAFMVYHFAFKALGILLFLVEIIWFVLLPIYKELKIWVEKRHELSWNQRNKTAAIILGTLLFLIVIPWRSSVKMPAILKAEKLTQIYTPKDAKIVQILVKTGAKVDAGAVLFKMASPTLDQKLLVAKHELKGLQQSYNQYATNTKVLDQKMILQQALLKKEQEINSLLLAQDALVLKAPFEGIVLLNDTFLQGQYVNHKEPIATLYDPKSLHVVGYSSDVEYPLLASGASGVFIAHAPGISPLGVVVKKRSPFSLVDVEYEELSSLYGGQIATRPMTEKNHGRLITEKAYFKVEALPFDTTKEYYHRVDGELIVDAKPSSILLTWVKKIVTILQKESGF
jgi:putative peptide zinc metalloprotease protein